MTTADEANKRRSSRVFLRLRVMAKGKNLDGRSFSQPTETIVINAHGGLLYLNETLEMGSEVTITNPETEDEQECRVVYLGGSADRGQRVGLEFLTPAPHFWGVEFPPPDWPGRASESQAQAS
jgi:hypothetical protein